jgi:hypothetical protein
MSQEEIDLEELDFSIEEASQQVDADITATKKELSNAKKQLKAALRANPIDVKQIFEAEDKIEGYEAGLKRLNNFKSERF